MLIELRVRNVAVLEDLTLRLAPGLNVITGETGAGKSIVIDALGLLMGARASTDLVRAGADRAVVEGVLDISGRMELNARLHALGFDADDDHIVLRRELNRAGRSRAWINGSPTTATILRDLSEGLVDVHGQHEHQRLLSPAVQTEVLDAFVGSTGQAAEVRALSERLKDLTRVRDEAETRRRELERRSDFLRFQLGELDDASLEDPDEEEMLEAELARLDHAEELSRGADGIHEELYGADRSLGDGLAQVLGRLRKLTRLDPGLSGHAELLEGAYHQIVEAARNLGDYARTVDLDPRRLEELRERRAQLHALKRKYGADLSEVIATRESLREELQALDAPELDVDRLEAAAEQARARLLSSARALSAARHEGARGLSSQVSALLPDVGLPAGAFAVEFDSREEPSAAGLEVARFVVSLNPGFPPAPLAKVASGGELSRVMLALKSVLSDVDRIPVVVFDEIDAGVGGAVATQVGSRLEAVSQGRQVLVVTHLAQIACRGAHHLSVEKHVEGGLTRTVVRELEGEARAREVARMLDGEPASAASMEHARALLGLDGVSVEGEASTRRAG